MATIGNLTNLSDSLDNDYDEREFKRGEVYFIDLEDIGYGSKYIQTKTRPALIIQNDVGNNRSHTIIIALLTTAFKKPYPFQYYCAINGKYSTIMFEQIMTIDKFRILTKLGELSYKQMKEADQKLMNSLQLSRLSFENIEDFTILSSVAKKTNFGNDVYFEIAIHFTNSHDIMISISLDNLQKFNKTITKSTSFVKLKKLLDCCKGLHWMFNNNEI